MNRQELRAQIAKLTQDLCRIRHNGPITRTQAESIEALRLDIRSHALALVRGER